MYADKPEEHSLPARRISFVNFKGGVGKTSLSVNIAASLALDLKQKVLFVDCDPQSNASIWLLGIKRWSDLQSDQSVCSLVSFPSPAVFDIVQKAAVRDHDGSIQIHTLDLIPSVYAWLDAEPNGGASPYVNFYEKIASLSPAYDFVVFDCPPNLYWQTQCAVFSSNEIYVPCNPDELSRMGLDLLDKKLRDFQAKSQPLSKSIPNYSFPAVRGVIFNAVNASAKQDGIRRIEQKVKNLKESSTVFDPHSTLFHVSVHQTVQAGQAVYEEAPVVLERKTSKLKEEYKALAKYIASIGERS